VTDYELLNSPEFIETVETGGPNSDHLRLPRTKVKLRFRPWHPGITPGTWSIDEAGTLHLTWHKVEGWEPKEAPGLFGRVHVVAPFDGGTASRPIADLHRGIHDTGISIPNFWHEAQLDDLEPDALCGVWVGGVEIARRTDLAPLRFSALERPEEPDRPEWQSEPDVRPEPFEIRIPDAFERLMDYPPTLEVGQMEIEIRRDHLRATWERDLGSLPRYESGDRFGRLCWVSWVQDEYAGAPGEHLRDGEEKGASIEMWADPPDNHTTLGQTMRAKAKDDKIQESGFEPAEARRLGCFVVTHDQNPNPQRTPITWFGEPFAEAEEPAEIVPWPGDNPALQLVMAPSSENLTVEQAEEFYREFIVGHGFHGFHVGLFRRLPSEGLIRLLSLAALHEFWVHLWLYGDREWDDRAPQDPNVSDERDFQRQVLVRIGGYANWSMGLGYDLPEWVTWDQVGGWVHFMHTEELRFHQYGGRQRPGGRPYPGHYVGWGHQVPDKSQLRQMLQVARVDRPCMTEDRFRIRGGRKDWTEAESLEGMRICLEEGYAAIWGNIGDRDQDLGSLPYLLKAQIRELLSPAPPVEPPPPDLPPGPPEPPILPPPRKKKWWEILLEALLRRWFRSR